MFATSFSRTLAPLCFLADYVHGAATHIYLAPIPFIAHILSASTLPLRPSTPLSPNALMPCAYISSIIGYSPLWVRRDSHRKAYLFPNKGGFVVFLEFTKLHQLLFELRSR